MSKISKEEYFSKTLNQMRVRLHSKSKIRPTTKESRLELKKRRDASAARICRLADSWKEGFKFGMQIKTIKSMKNVRKIDIQNTSSNDFTDESLKDLGDYLRKLPYLQSLNLFISPPNMMRITDKGLRYFRDALKHLKSLRFLGFNFQISRSTTDEGMIYLVAGLKRLCSLQSITLNCRPYLLNCVPLYHYFISQKSVNHLTRNLKRLGSLHSANLSFSQNPKTVDSDLDALQNLQKSSSLKFITLKFGSDLAITKRDLKGTCGNITDQALKTLSQSLKKLRSLQSIDLHFLFCLHVTKKGINAICKSLRSLKSLKGIHLNFNKYGDIVDENLKTLGQSLAKLKSLQSIILNFDSCWKITGKGLKTLSEGIQKLSSLTSINLDFRSCSGISDEGLKDLGESFKGLNSLQSLVIDFSLCEKITDKGLKSLGESLQELTSLCEISVDTNNCKKIIGCGLEEFFNGLPKANSSRSVNAK